MKMSLIDLKDLAWANAKDEQYCSSFFLLVS